MRLPSILFWTILTTAWLAGCVEGASTTDASDAAPGTADKMASGSAEPSPQVVAESRGFLILPSSPLRLPVTLEKSAAAVLIEIRFDLEATPGGYSVEGLGACAETPEAVTLSAGGGASDVIVCRNAAPGDHELVVTAGFATGDVRVVAEYGP